MGLRTQRYGPTEMTRRGESHTPGVPRPTAPKSHWQEEDSKVPDAIRATLYQATGFSEPPWRVRISQGTYTPPNPGTTTVKTILRRRRLMLLRFVVAVLLDC